MGEDFLSQIIVQTAWPSPGVMSRLCAWWHWTFWLGILVGVVGSVAGFLMKGPQQR